GRQPRGGFLWPRLAEAQPTVFDLVPPAATAAQTAAQAAPGTTLWEAMRPAAPTMVPVLPSASEDPERQETRNALELARPIRRLVHGGVGQGPASEGARFYEQQPPVVRAAPSSEAAAKMVEAVRATPASGPSDDRVSLGDLTLISIASATHQVAASREGG